MIKISQQAYGLKKTEEDDDDDDEGQCHPHRDPADDTRDFCGTRQKVTCPKAQHFVEK